MLIKVELSKDEVKVLLDRQVFRMQWILAGMDGKEPLDIVIQKVVNAAIAAGLIKVDISS